MPDSYDAGDHLSLEELGQFAKQQRKAEGETQEDAAAALDVEQSNVSRAENGRSNSKGTLFHLIRRYTDFDVVPKPHYRLIKKKDR